eukprot:387226_1
MPAETSYVPADTSFVPSETSYVPATTSFVPATTRYVPILDALPPYPGSLDSENPGLDSEKTVYPCRHCKKGLATMKSREIHERSHSGAKPFECMYPGCQKRYSSRQQLRKHD